MIGFDGISFKICASSGWGNHHLNYLSKIIIANYNSNYALAYA